MKTLSAKNGDLHLDSAGNLASVSDLEALRQNIQSHLRTMQGEWVLNVKFGIPYLQKILKLTVKEFEVTHIFDKAILEFEEVNGISISRGFINNKKRTYSYFASVTTIYGETGVKIDG